MLDRTAELTDIEVTARPDRYRFVDGLRGLFSVVVLLFHVFFVFFEHSMPSYRHFGMVFDGTTAVHVFFVLSGFSLSVGYLRSLALGAPDADDTLRRMASARYVRLAIPCAAACLLMYAVMAAGQNYFAKIPDESKIQWWAWAYKDQSVNVWQALKFSLYDIFLPLLFIPTVPYTGPYFITNLWTMPIEFIGSMIVFAYCFAVKQNPYRLVLTLTLAMVLAAARSHLAFFFAGVAVADVFLRFKDRRFILWREIAIATALAALFLFWRGQKFQIEVIICTSFVLLAALGYWTRSFFGTGIFRYLGRISFALYLVHMPVIVSVQSYLFLAYRDKISSVEIILLAGGSSLVISFAIAHVFSGIDRFAIKLSHAVGRAVTRT